MYDDAGRTEEEVQALLGLLRQQAPPYQDDVGCCKACRRGEAHLTCLLLTMVMAGLVWVGVRFIGTDEVGWLTSNPDHMLGVGVGVYLVYIGECFSSEAAMLLWGITSGVAEGERLFLRMLDAPPYFRWTSRSFHTEAAGGREQRVYTHSRSMLYPLNGCADETSLAQRTSHRLCKTRFEYEVRWRDEESRQRYAEAQQAFADGGDGLDEDQELHEQVSLVGFQSQALTSRDGDALPCWVSWGCFVCACVLGLGFVYRVGFSAATGVRTTKLVKVVW